ncbi:MAG: hypothetical protein K5871_07035 [Lachnospiraceae bacterium]|nr:hypothetical protein [Lachnospiraceae bacterium]
MYGLIFVAIILVLLAVSGYRMSIEEKKKTVRKISDSFGMPSSRKISEARRQALVRNIDLLKGEAASGDLIDDLTWSDTGMEDIFLQMDNCLSSAGEETLYYTLHDVSKPAEDIAATDKAVGDLSSDEKLRLELGVALSGLGFVKDRPFPEYLQHIRGSEKIISPFFHILCDFYYVVIIFLMFMNPVLGSVFLVIVLVVQISSYFSLRKKAEESLCGMSMITRLSSMGSHLPKGYDSYAGQLCDQLSKDLASFRKGTVLSSFVISTGPNSQGGLISMIFTYLNLLFHFDLIAASFLLSGIKENSARIMNAYKTAGFLDMCLSVASYRAYLEKKGGWCVPEFIEDRGISIEKGFIPLIDKPVANDAFTSGGVLITGSNASGKSTYMRMIAVNTILAQSVATCPAVSYKACRFRIYSSIAVNDNILKGESYFMAEIGSLKRIVDAAMADGRPIICFIDEILRGTNTSERISAACAVLKYLAELDVIVFAATHDLELTVMIGDKYENVHFTENITGDDVTFSYVLEKGPTNSRNAIALLRKNGFPDSIINESEKLCMDLTKKA